jgi:hypothetical protein
MRRSYVVPMRWMVIYVYEVPGGALNLSSTNYPDHVHYGNLTFQGKIPIVEQGIEPGTSCSVIRNSEHEASHNEISGPTKRHRVCDQ